MLETTRLVQLKHNIHGRKIALVKEPQLLLLDGFTSIYELALEAIRSNQKLVSLVSGMVTAQTLDYDLVYEGGSEWELLPAFDNPESVHATMVSGTGLTHNNSALNRQMMHQSEANQITDSMKIYQWGVEGGLPEEGEIGIQPEWFYKGNGTALRAHNQSLELPSYGNDGGEEPEIAGAYIVDELGNPWRIGFTTGNEYSDHVMEKKNYLYLAPSKLRQCAIGPELVLDADFSSLEGKVSVARNGLEIWSAEIKTGEKNMVHSLANLEHHHFKYPNHRVPLQAHVHFYGADAFSYGAGIKLQNNDWMEVFWKTMGRPLRNPIKMVAEKDSLNKVKQV